VKIPTEPLPHSLFYVRWRSRVGRFPVQLEGAAPLLPVGEVEATRKVISVVAVAHASAVAITHGWHVVVVLAAPTPSFAEMTKNSKLFFFARTYVNIAC
jgi:hypothetical protein